MYCTHENVEGLLRQWLARDEHYVEAGCELGIKGAHHRAQPPPNPIPRDRVAQALTDNEPISIVRSLIRREAQQHQAVRVRHAHLAQAAKILCPAQP